MKITLNKENAEKLGLSEGIQIRILEDTKTDNWLFTKFMKLYFNPIEHGYRKGLSLEDYYYKNLSNFNKEWRRFGGNTNYILKLINYYDNPESIESIKKQLNI